MPVTLFTSILVFGFFMIQKKMLIVTVRKFFWLISMFSKLNYGFQ
ncbi:hypothetical protein TSAR_015560 [Trichomalopsis sarcophagae]|uniref:Uncharacterized protein n=1 Tax=Trichomalopsis sarcophagae TaxID=543379 RepID=A0A232EI52_9HYME|nr:hypothetical protein TSAR_015560 [Trichomalopsis sarcophagae]